MYKEPKSKIFIASCVVHQIMLLTIIVLIPVILSTAIFFIVNNKSNYPEIGDAFSKIELYLNGHCIFMVDKSMSCSRQNFLEMFYKMPNFASMPTKFSPVDIPFIFSSISVNNPLVFIPLILTETVALVSFSFGYVSFIKMTRKYIIRNIITNVIMLLFCSISLGISEKIYNDIIPSNINRPITVTVQNSGSSSSSELTGKPGVVGIYFNSWSNGKNYLVTLVIMSCLTMLMSCRWAVESRKKESKSLIDR